MWGALSVERTGLSFTIAAGPSQRSHSRVRAPWDSRSYFTVSDLRLPFSSPPTTRRVTVEVFDPASTRVCLEWTNQLLFITATEPEYKSPSRTVNCPLLFWLLPRECLCQYLLRRKQVLANRCLANGHIPSQ
jgi:hypothetical protein